MRLMHTKLPDFIKKVKQAATKSRPEMTLEITGIENIKTAKAQSLRTGRIESAIEELAQAEGVDIAKVVLRGPAKDAFAPTTEAEPSSPTGL